VVRHYGLVSSTGKLQPVSGDVAFSALSGFAEAKSRWMPDHPPEADGMTNRKAFGCQGRHSGGCRNPVTLFKIHYAVL